MDVAPFTLCRAMGGVIALGIDHRDVVPLPLPGRTFDGERAARLGAGHRFPSPARHHCLPIFPAYRPTLRVAMHKRKITESPAPK